MAITCTNCGYAYNQDSEAKCSMCNQPLSPEDGAQTASLVPSGPTPSGPGIPSVAGAGKPPAAPGGGAPVIPENPQDGRATSEGRIIHIERADEKPPGNIYRILARIMIWILIAIPYTGLFMASGIISIAFGILRFQALSHLFNPVIWTTAIVELMEVFVLRGLRGVDTVPVYRGTLEDTQGRDRHFIMFGPLEGAGLVEGRQVRLTGTMRRGTLCADTGQDVITGSIIAARNRNRWRTVFIVLVSIYLGLAFAGLYLALQTNPG